MSDQAVIIKCRVWGGETGVTSKLAPKLGPLGVPAPKVAVVLNLLCLLTITVWFVKSSDDEC